ncbi:MAG: hypothetical protein M1814_001322 [Vezdaea aestivalis]|nr:MAG: hypothetical protein M1814_001322 [Vezdaea aestivalis]
MLCQRCIRLARSRSRATTPRTPYTIRPQLANSYRGFSTSLRRPEQADKIDTSELEKSARGSTNPSERPLPYSKPLSELSQSGDAAAAGERVSHPPSSVAGGTALEGLGYNKNNGDPIAMEDHEYPDWLWGCLDMRKKDASTVLSEAGYDADMFSKSKKERRKAANRARKAGLEEKATGLPPVPLHHESIDLPSNEEGTIVGALQASKQRAELTKEMRQARRQAIKEKNFLKTMR